MQCGIRMKKLKYYLQSTSELDADCLIDGNRKLIKDIKASTIDSITHQFVEHRQQDKSLLRSQ